MDDLRRELIKAVNDSFSEVRSALSAFRKETRAEFEEQQRLIDSLRQSVGRQAHVLDQGLARVDETLSAHRENVGKVLYTFVDDVNGLKSDMRAVKSRLDVLEGKSPPAA